MRRLMMSGYAALALAAVALTPAAASAQETGDLETRIAQIEARQEITELLNEYGRTLDKRQFDAYADLFAEDGEWIGGLGAHAGRAAVREMVGTMPPNPDGGLTGFHVISNAIIDLADDLQTATAESRWSFYNEGEDGRPQMLMGGRYIDDLVRTDEGWKFQRRIAYGDIPFDDPLADD